MRTGSAGTLRSATVVWPRRRRPRRRRRALASFQIPFLRVTIHAPGPLDASGLVQDRSRARSRTHASNPSQRPSRAFFSVWRLVIALSLGRRRAFSFSRWLSGFTASIAIAPCLLLRAAAIAMLFLLRALGIGAFIAFRSFRTRASIR